MILLVESKTGKQVIVWSLEDANRLIKTGSYRYPSAREQNQYAREKRKEGLLYE